MAGQSSLGKSCGFPKAGFNLERFVPRHATAHIQTRCKQFGKNKLLDKLKIPAPTKTDLITGVIIFILILVIGKSFDFENFGEHNNGKEYFMPNLYRVNKAIITDKYIDKENHAYKTIELTVNDSLEYYYTLDWDVELYEYIEISDSIIKTNFGNEIIIRRNKSDSIFKLNLKGYD